MTRWLSIFLVLCLLLGIAWTGLLLTVANADRVPVEVTPPVPRALPKPPVRLVCKMDLRPPYGSIRQESAYDLR